MALVDDFNQFEEESKEIATQMVMTIGELGSAF
jgi:hypothetical protein